MGEFYESIEKELAELDQLDPGLPGVGATFGAEEGSSSEFGADYTSNPTVVKQVQVAINAAGYTPPLATDGAYGPATKAGVQWLQGQNGLTQDGIIGDQTLGSLGITPPTGLSVEYGKGAAKGAAAAAIAALQAQFSPLFSWAKANPQPLTQGKGIAPGFQATKASVVNSYVAWTTPLEGFLPHMYIDALGYVTTGMGNLIDPVTSALVLPWKRPDGSLASQAEIEAAWSAVDSLRSDPKGQKQTSGPATQGGGSQGGHTTIRITKADVQKLVADKMRANEATMLQGLPNFAKAPADAQLAAHSQSWAMGPGWAVPGNPKHFPALTAAFNQGDYETAAANAHMQGTGIDMRNMANKLLLTNAAQVVKRKKSPDTLYYITGLTDLFSGPNLWLIGGVIAGIAAVITAIVMATKRA